MDAIDWPFRASEQLAAGALTIRQLRRHYQAVYPGVWIPRGAELDAAGRARAAWLWSSRRGVLGGLSAAATLGTRWIEGEAAAELVHDNRRPPAGIIVHTCVLESDEVVARGDLVLTTPARTAFDLGRRLPTTEAVQRIDALMNATHVKAADIECIGSRHPGARGLRRLRRALELVDGGAESPYESLTRLTLIRAGLPVPQTQIEVRNAVGRVFARLDMGWPEWKVAVEYDGAQHWTDARQRAWDIERLAELEAAGWLVIRVSSAMLARSAATTDRVRRALQARGWPG
ncbi:endonuclease domain-containing protein [Mycolicibacterium chlorophenolicum]|uniref:DUF559 domain-containing protein n=1 Tax=Mycolicibacterium chlorophenolicum TaxID=37916 RepID=A0A0J6WP91_9MYCO|nr:DUF559 domain-containing protein [Mycolicibacterium chlorophenolicum]KMO83918.1 hypothetical protein MCHLDSM_00054 [Mycolicibacterium chlorophenolicum]